MPYTLSYSKFFHLLTWFDIILTNANHVIFVSPLLSETQHGYAAS